MTTEEIQRLIDLNEKMSSQIIHPADTVFRPTAAALRELLRLTQALQRTADGHLLVPGMTVYYPWGGKDVVGLVHIRYEPSMCYSTRKAATAAKEVA